MSIFRTGLVAESFHKLGPVHATFERITMSSGEPHKWHAIGYHQVCRVQNLLKEFVVLSFGDTVHTGHCDEARCAAFGDPALHSRDYVRNLDRIHLNSKNLEHRALWESDGTRWPLRGLFTHLRSYVENGSSRSVAALFAGATLASLPK